MLHNAARNGHLWALTYLLATAARAGMDKDTIKRFCEVRAQKKLVLILDAGDRGGCEEGRESDADANSRSLLSLTPSAPLPLCPQAPDKEDHTCLEWACFNGHLPVVQYLIRSAGMDPNRTDTGVRGSRETSAHNKHKFKIIL